MQDLNNDGVVDRRDVVVLVLNIIVSAANVLINFFVR